MAEYCSDRFELVEDNEDNFQMWQGLVGPHYTPIVSNDGTLRWTNNGLLQNPDEVNLRGPQGAGITIAGIRESTSELPASAPPGALWLVGTETPYEAYSYIADEWIDLGEMTVGPAGPPGPQGDDYVLTAADKTEIAGAAETLLLNDLSNNPLPVSKGGTGAQTLADAQENLGITDLADQIGDTPLATTAQDIRGAVNEIVGDLGSLDFDTTAQNVTGAINEVLAGLSYHPGDSYASALYLPYTAAVISATQISVNVNLPKLLPSNVAVTVTDLRGRMSGVGGSIDGLSSVTSAILSNSTTYAVTASRSSPNSVRIDVSKKTGDLSNATTSTPVAFVGYIGLSFTAST